ncbi:endo-1,4-beta-xylanase [Tangfeifania diversioriginum]|uniref:Beta-xylanase n=1 Tax=Tangfeifania diversioriginum TaxID=1168035 RepID=A0A1M6P9X7_9BACT|nr:endo-1,4-beta-xylanase [Tangfeifania diversioriginum]SHK04781.1 endo-1,4-beta-xylanase [Tangfeifania diversioriginum]
MKHLFTAVFVISVLFTSCNQTPSSEENEGLKDVTGLYVGTAVNYRQVTTRDTIRSIIVNDFSSITPENEMKMYSVLSGHGEYRWNGVDTMVAFARRNNLRLFGHCLIWHSGTPGWLTEMEHDSTSLSNFMKEYIHTYVSKYKNDVDGWDVVNEAITDSAGTMRETFWYNLLGESYIDQAFRAAHEADPEAVLFINDYNNERDTVKMNATIDLINRLKSRGVPVSGIGLQMHTRMDIPDEIIALNLKKAAETGLQVHLSEVDVIFNRHNDQPGGGEQIYPELTEEMLQRQGEKYRKIAEMYRDIVPENQQYGITVWGFNDRTSWIPGFFGMKDWPTLYDENLQKKPAYYGFKEGLSE